MGNIGRRTGRAGEADRCLSQFGIDGNMGHHNSCTYSAQSVRNHIYIRAYLVFPGSIDGIRSFGGAGEGNSINWMTFGTTNNDGDESLRSVVGVFFRHRTVLESAWERFMGGDTEGGIDLV